MILLCALEAACLPTSGGTGIGPPNAPSRAPARLYGISIVQVYAGDPNLRVNPSQVSTANPNAFVQIANESDSVFSFSQTPLMLVGSGNRRIDLSTLMDLQPQARTIVDATALDLHAAAGELALTDTQFNAQSYIAWGNAPGQFGGGVFNQAASLATTEGATWVQVPFLNTTNLAIASDPNAQNPNLRDSGCVAPDEARGASSAAPTQCPANGPAPLLQVTEVAPPLGVGAESWVEVLNLSAGPIDLYGCLLCYQDACGMIDVSAVIANPQSAEDTTHPARVVLYLGGNSGDHNTVTQIDLPNLPPLRSSDELALAPPGAAGAATDLMTLSNAWSYVRYSNNPQGSPPTRFLQQLPPSVWDGSTNAALGPRVPGESVALSPGSGPGAAAWHPAAATPAARNVTYDSANLATWTSCSYPPAPVAGAGLAISEVALNTGLVTLKNRSAAAIDLTGWQLAAPGLSVALPARSLAAGDSLVVEIHADGTACSDPARVCWNNATLAAHELTIIASDSKLAHHLQWGGAPPDANSRGDTAKGQGVWPGLTCQVQQPSPLGDLISLSANDGRSPPDYVFATQ